MNKATLIAITIDTSSAEKYGLPGGDWLAHWSDDHVSRHGRYDDPRAEARKYWDSCKGSEWNKAKRP